MIRARHVWALTLVVAVTATACDRRGKASPDRAAPPPSPAAVASVASAPSASSAAEARPGMVYIPAGTLRRGTPPEATPRIADEEAPGDAVDVGAFYIDALPFPNEPGAIPTTHVTRAEAQEQCARGGKRLCTEVEWERACKGPTGTAYPYGDVYRAAACGTGVTIEEASRRPTGEHAQCKSAFGVMDTHGGVWEWTSSTWARGSSDASIGVLKGGNSRAGELVGRCANAIGRPQGKRSTTMGFRCCAGTPTEVPATFPLVGVPGLEPARADRVSETFGAYVSAAVASAGGRVSYLKAWTWQPVRNEKLSAFVACSSGGCAAFIGREEGGKATLLATVPCGKQADLLRLGDPRSLRLRSIDGRGTYARDVTYMYGRVDVADVARP